MVSTFHELLLFYIYNLFLRVGIFFFGENPFSTCQSFLNLLAFRNTLRALFYDFPIGDEGC